MTPLSSSALLLPHLGVIAVRGTDARRFLNGQLSQDVLALAPDRVELAGLHNPQGRTVAIVRLVPSGPTDVLLVMPRTLIPEVVTGLRKYLLRAKATLVDESPNWRIEGLIDEAELSSSKDPTPMGSARLEAGRSLWRHADDGRVMCLTPASQTTDEAISEPDRARLEAWHLADIAAGLPDITPETRGEFVAQMLNLDALGGISFTKGCYTGQEVIARAHYRGRVKRRAQRFRLESPMSATMALQPGMKCQLTADGWTRAAQIVNVATHNGVSEFLAVTGFGDATPEPEATNTTTTAVKAVSQPMSYTLPE